MNTTAEITEANAQAVMDTFNGLEESRVAATRRYEIANRMHQNAIAAMAHALIDAGGDLLNESVRQAAAEVVRTAHTTFSARAEEKALGSAVQVISEAIRKNGALRKE